MKISYGKNIYGKEEINAVVTKLNKTTQMGNSVYNFEKKISKYFSKKYGLMVNSGSSALALANNVLNFKKGDEIITPCLNFGTAVSSIILSNATPIFVDTTHFLFCTGLGLCHKLIESKLWTVVLSSFYG